MTIEAEVGSYVNRGMPVTTISPEILGQNNNCFQKASGEA